MIFSSSRKKIITQNSIHFQKLRLAVPKDLHIGTHYYLAMQDGNLILDRVRDKLRSETIKEHQKYKDYLLVICNRQRCYVFNQDTKVDASMI